MARDVVEEEERLRARAEDVVDAVRGEVRPGRASRPARAREDELRADAVRGGREEAFLVERVEAGEGAEIRSCRSTRQPRAAVRRPTRRARARPLRPRTSSPPLLTSLFGVAAAYTRRDAARPFRRRRRGRSSRSSSSRSRSARSSTGSGPGRSRGKGTPVAEWRYFLFSARRRARRRRARLADRDARRGGVVRVPHGAAPAARRPRAALHRRRADRADAAADPVGARRASPALPHAPVRRRSRSGRSTSSSGTCRPSGRRRSATRPCMLSSTSASSLPARSCGRP